MQRKHKAPDGEARARPKKPAHSIPDETNVIHLLQVGLQSKTHARMTSGQLKAMRTSDSKKKKRHSKPAHLKEFLVEWLPHSLRISRSLRLACRSFAEARSLAACSLVVCSA